ncbi:hypothetical protein COCOBI_08-0680 [Coccomyxa sp. Obi]|nr:hypothetical protein COCOBI_08-0680 [Coccomyxa sp. Obi]
MGGTGHSAVFGRTHRTKGPTHSAFLAPGCSYTPLLSYVGFKAQEQIKAVGCGGLAQLQASRRPSQDIYGAFEHIPEVHEKRSEKMRNAQQLVCAWAQVQGTTVIKIVRVAPPNLPPEGAWLDHSAALHLEKCSVSFAAVRMPQNCLDRPKVCTKDALGPLLSSRQAGDAVLSAMEAFKQAESAPEMPLGLLMDGTQIADRMALLHFDANTCGLLLVASATIGELVLLPPEGLDAAPQANGQPGQQAATAPAAASAASPAAAASTGPSQSKDAGTELGTILGLTEGELALAAQKATVHAANTARRRAAAGGNPGDPTRGTEGTVVWVVWAEAHLERISPSLLLGYALLASRRESALFLRMATGFGFAQMGDYNASSFYRFAKRGHRFKCWECGVKKKAPCGEVDRADLPWCCHRRLGAYLPLLSASQAAATPPNAISIQSKSVCFVPLLPPKEAQTDPTNPLGVQLAHIPPPASVVALAELLAHKPTHPVECIGTALARLAPTCRSLWDTPWICDRLSHVVAGSEEAATAVHRWLEKTAFFKMPRSQEQELVAEMKQPFEDLVGEIVPDVEGAPCLGGHNRTAGPDGAPPPPIPTVKMVDPELGISSDAVRRKRMVNTGQGRRRLNARAALRTVAIAGRRGARSGSPGQLPDAAGTASDSTAAAAAAASAPAGAPSGGDQPVASTGQQQAASEPARTAARPPGRPPGRGRGRSRGTGAGRGRPPKSRKKDSDSEDDLTDQDEDALDEAMQGLEALQHASPARKRQAAAAKRPGARTRRSITPPPEPEEKSPMSSPDFAKIRPPRKLRSGPKQLESKGEGAEDGGEDHPNDGGDDGGDAPMEEEPPSSSGQAALTTRRSPRVAGKNPASDGIESERPAKRQRRNSTESAGAKTHTAPDAAPVKRSPGRPRKHPLPNPEPAAPAPAERAAASGGSRGSAREPERQMQAAASGDGGAQRSGSAGGVQPARSGSTGGVGRPPRQPTPAGAAGAAPMRAGPGGPIRPGPAGAVRPAVPLLVLQPEQLQRAESGVLSLPPQISNLLSAGSIQVLISTTLPARTINDRASLETLSRFLAGAPPYRPPAPGGGPPAGGPRPSPQAAGPGRTPQPPPHSSWQLPLHPPFSPHNGQAPQQRDAQARPASDAPAVPDAAVMMTVKEQRAKLHSSHKAASTAWQPAVGALPIMS